MAIRPRKETAIAIENVDVSGRMVAHPPFEDLPRSSHSAHARCPQRAARASALRQRKLERSGTLKAFRADPRPRPPVHPHPMDRVTQGTVTRRWCVLEFDVANDTAGRDLKELTDLGLILAQGKGRAVRYLLKATDNRPMKS